MSSYRSCALLASAALVLGGVLSPVAAFADDSTTGDPAVTTPTDATDTSTADPTDTTAADPTDTPTADPAPTVTKLDIEQLRNDLTALQNSALAAEKPGWSLTGTDAESGGKTETVSARYDGSAGTLTETGYGSVIEVQGTGTYLTVSSLSDMPGLRGALKALAKPHATWIFEPDRTLDLLTGDGSTASVSPSGALEAFADPKAAFSSSPTETVAADGTTTYQFDVTMPADSGDDGGSVTLTVDPSGLLQSLDQVGPTEQTSVTYTYAAQQPIDIPAKSTVVTEDQLFQGMMLSSLPAETRAVAKQVATQVTKKHAANARTIRSAAKILVARQNRMLGGKVLTTKPVAGGVKIVGTDRFTHTHTTYTVTAQGSKAVVRKG